MELCKTRIKKSCPNMFKFYVTLAGHDMVTNAGRATNYKQNIKAPWLPTKEETMKDLPKTWVLTGKQFEDFRRKKEQKLKLRFSKTASGTQGP